MPERVTIALPLFGGQTSYVDTLDAVLSFVEVATPPEPELVNWFKNEFANVSSEYSIKRRLSFLCSIRLLEKSEAAVYTLGPAGQRATQGQLDDVLFNLFHNRLIGFSALLVELCREERSTEEIAELYDQDFDQAKWKLNWQYSLGLLDRTEDGYRATQKGQQFVDAYVPVEE